MFVEAKRSSPWRVSAQEMKSWRDQRGLTNGEIGFGGMCLENRRGVEMTRPWLWRVPIVERRAGRRWPEAI
jgi:hypothetical protein